MSEIENVMMQRLAALEEHWKLLETDFTARLGASEKLVQGYETDLNKVLEDSAAFYEQKLRSFQESFTKELKSSLGKQLAGWREDYEIMLEARTQEHEEQVSNLKTQLESLQIQLQSLNGQLEKLFTQIKTLE